MNDINTNETALDGSFTSTAEMLSENVDYTELLTSICDNQSSQIELLQEQNNLLTETNQICWWIFFILALYGLYKIFLGNILSWFNGT